MRNTILVSLIMMVAALILCAVRAKRSEKSIGHSVYALLLSLIPPIAGNIIIIASRTQLPAEIGCYIYFIGMDITMAFLLKFTIDYCNYSWDNKTVISLVYSLFTIDILQLLLNPLLGHAFSTRRIIVEGAAYFQMVPYLGQTFHRMVAYGFFFASLVLISVKAVRTSRIYVERYAVILLSMLIGGLWETFYIGSGTPVDTSMIGFAIFGFLVYYFSLYYKPRILVDRMLANVVSSLPEAMFFFDGEKKCVWANTKGKDLIGIDDSRLEEAGQLLRVKFPSLREEHRDWREDFTTGSGEDRRYYTLEKRSVIDKKDRYAGVFLSVTDNTEAQRELEAEQYNARHDRLTGLYNKEYMYKRTRELLDENPDVPYVLAFIDISEFKMVNDVFGKDFGDHVLLDLAGWIRSDMNERCVYGRLGGDTFGVCMPGAEFDPIGLNEMLSKYVVRWNGREHHILAHIGVYRIEDKDLDISIMVDRARMALTRIKKTYSHIAYYDDSIRDMMLWNQQISAQLDEAIEERQIIPYLQPIVDANGRVVGAEALARWIHPEKGYLSPAEFIPLFEQNGKISEVDRYIWRCACELLQSWRVKRPDMFLSVNISPIDFYYMDLRLEMAHLVQEFGIEPHMLRLEITESVMMSNIEERLDTINGLREDGFIIEMDDFGSGYSSLNMLKDMPVDLVKVDMAFLRKSRDNNKAHIILEDVIKLVEALGMVSLTEGVETDEQFRTLADMGCKLFQGFHFAKPLPTDEFEKYVDNAMG